jgi:hypothetical protein
MRLPSTLAADSHVFNQMSLNETGRYQMLQTLKQTLKIKNISITVKVKKKVKAYMVVRC